MSLASWFYTSYNNHDYFVWHLLFISESEEPEAVIIEQVPEDKIGELGQAFEVSLN